MQVPHSARLLCFASLLPASVQAADSQSAALLPRITVMFVAEQIKVCTCAYVCGVWRVCMCVRM